MLAVLCALALAGCLAPSNFDGGAATIRALNATPAELATPKTVYFVTTRCDDQPTAGAPGTAEELFRKRCWEASLGNEELHRLGYGMADGGSIHCGTAVVSVAALSAPSDATTTIQTPINAACGNFDPLRQAIAATPCRCALIFVHGYNTTFGYGLRRTAQLSLDLSYPGVPILFSFAAGGRLGDYVNDTEAAELAAPALHQLMIALSRNDGSGAPAIDVVAHSMGGRLTLRAIDEGDAPSLRFVVMAAPDVDPAAFLRLAEKAAPHTQRLTVYTAKYDVAMAASNSAHAGWNRTGEGLPPGVTQSIAHAEIIDATARATDPYAHSYFAESKVVLDDIKLALQGQGAAQRQPLVCNPSGAAIACTIPCPPGASCGPTLYQRFVHWLFG